VSHGNAENAGNAVAGVVPPSEAESAITDVAPFLDMTPDERLRHLAALVRALAAFAGDRPIVCDDDLDPFWRRWKDGRAGGGRS